MSLTSPTLLVCREFSHIHPDSVSTRPSVVAVHYLSPSPGLPDADVPTHVSPLLTLPHGRRSSPTLLSVASCGHVPRFTVQDSLVTVAVCSGLIPPRLPPCRVVSLSRHFSFTMLLVTVCYTSSFGSCGPERVYSEDVQTTLLYVFGIYTLRTTATKRRRTNDTFHILYI